MAKSTATAENLLGLLGLVLLLMFPSAAFCEKLDLVGFTPGMPYGEAEAKVAKFRFCQQGMSIEETLSIICENKVTLLFSSTSGEIPVLLAIQLSINTTDDLPTVLTDISKQFDGKSFSKNVEARSKESMQMSSDEYVNYYYWMLPQGLELRYIPARGVLQPAPAAGTLMLQNAELIQRHKDQVIRRSLKSVPRL